MQSDMTLTGLPSCISLSVNKAANLAQYGSFLAVFTISDHNRGPDPRKAKPLFPWQTNWKAFTG